MKHFIFALAISLALTGCKKDPETIEVNPCGLAFSTSLSYIAIGDEFSSGVFIEEGEDWPTEVQNFLNTHGHPNTTLDYLGSSGVRIADLNSTVDGNAAMDCKNLATIMVGVHDQLAGMTAAEFKTALTSLVINVKSYVPESDHITCVSLPDYSQAPGLPASAGTPAQVNAMIQAYNQAIAEVSSELGIGFADIYPISVAAYENGLYVSEDNFHANANQIELWASVVRDIVSGNLD